MRKRILLLIIGIVSLILFIYASNYRQDIPPGIQKDHWIEISSGFGLYIKDASINILALQKDSTQIVTKVVENNILNGTFMIKKDGNWFKI